MFCGLCHFLKRIASQEFGIASFCAADFAISCRGLPVKTLKLPVSLRGLCHFLKRIASVDIEVASFCATDFAIS